MKYLMAKKDGYDYFSKCSITVNELLTERERNILCPYIDNSIFETVKIKKTETYHAFGTRFPMDRATVICGKNVYFFCGHGHNGKLVEAILL